MTAADLICALVKDDFCEPVSIDLGNGRLAVVHHVELNNLSARGAVLTMDGCGLCPTTLEGDSLPQHCNSCGGTGFELINPTPAPGRE